MRATVVLLVLLAMAAAAREGCDMCPQSGTRLFPCAMTRYSTPLKLGGVIGLSINHLTGWDSYHGPFLQVEPGFGGGRINAGYRFGANHLVPLWNAGLAASLMRTWGDPLGNVEPDQTYCGVEVVGALFVLGLSGGVFRHVDGDDDRHDWIYTLGLGAGF